MSYCFHECRERKEMICTGAKLKICVLAVILKRAVLPLPGEYLTMSGETLVLSQLGVWLSGSCYSYLMGRKQRYR